MAPFAPDQTFPNALQVAPGQSPHWLGTDDLGRDVLSRLLYGARITFGLGLSVVFLSTLLGCLLGLWAGVEGGRIDAALMRATDILMTLPSLLLALVVVSVLGPSLENTVLAITIVSLPGVIRIVRGAAQVEMRKSYIEAALAQGSRRSRLALRQVLPNCMASLAVQVCLGLSDAILNASALGFLGLGVQPPTPEWGVMLADGRAYLESAWWMVTFPGVAILVTVLAFNLLGDHLQQLWFRR